MSLTFRIIDTVFAVSPLTPPTQLQMPFNPTTVAALVDSVPKPTAEKLNGKKLGYGTAGFRAPHYLLESVCLRMGMMAALRSYIQILIYILLLCIRHTVVMNKSVYIGTTPGTCNSNS